MGQFSHFGYQTEISCAKLPTMTDAHLHNNAGERKLFFLGGGGGSIQCSFKITINQLPHACAQVTSSVDTHYLWGN